MIFVNKKFTNVKTVGTFGVLLQYLVDDLKQYTTIVHEWN